MTLPQQFLERFLQESTAAWAVARPYLAAVYTKYFGEPLSQQAERYMPFDSVRATVEDVHQSDGIATAIAHEHFKGGDIRKRYRLIADGESWKIIAIERECYMCSATGRSNGTKCEHCDGEG